MKLSDTYKKEIIHIALGVLGFSLATFAVCIVLNCISLRLCLFTLGGSLIALTGFVWLCFSINKNIENNPGNIKTAMTKSYLGRMVLYGAWVIISVVFGGSSAVQICGSIPILFPSFTIKLMNLVNSLLKKKEE